MQIATTLNQAPYNYGDHNFKALLQGKWMIF